MKIMISAGEASGDMHAASALKQLRELSMDTIDAFGMGGRRLADCDMELLVDTRDHSVMGLVEVLHKYPQLRANLSTLKRALKERRPDVLLLVDYPHFNMKLASEAKSLGIPVLYYIAPKVWASRPSRVQELAQSIDEMAVIFPFEVSIFEGAGIYTKYVGNPVLENPGLSYARQQKVVSENCIALLPGSRKNEINHLLPPMLEAALMLSEQRADAKFVLPVAETIDPGMIQELVDKSEIDIDLIQASDFFRLKRCRAALVSSGTATLELALLEIPMVVAYKMNTLSYRVLRRWLSIEHVSLVNIIAEQGVVPELLQEEATAVRMYEEIIQLLESPEHRNKQIAGFDTVHQKLSRQDVNDNLASMLISRHQSRLSERDNQANISLSN